MGRIGIIGSGFVGVAVGKGLKKLGNEVIFHDIKEKKIKTLQDLGFSATTNLDYVIHNSEISFLCVPTPTKQGKIDLSYIKMATKALAKCLKIRDDYHLVVVKSTVMPMTTEKIIIPLLERYSLKKVGRGIGVCTNPEFLTESHRSWTGDNLFSRDFLSERMIVIGQFDKKSGNMLQKLYKASKIHIIRTNLKTAELIKYAVNCALATRISYWNEIFYICQKLKVDSNLVARTAAMDERVGKYGTVHGKAFGGKCLPKDLKAFISFAKELSHTPELLEAVDNINERIKAEKGVRE